MHAFVHVVRVSSSRNWKAGKRGDYYTVLYIEKSFLFFFKSSEVSKIEDRLCFFFFFLLISFFFCFCFLNWRLECYGVVGNSGGTVMKMKL